MYCPNLLAVLPAPLSSLSTRGIKQPSHPKFLKHCRGQKFQSDNEKITLFLQYLTHVQQLNCA